MAIVSIEDRALQDAVAVLRAAVHPDVTFIRVARVIQGLQQVKPKKPGITKKKKVRKG